MDLLASLNTFPMLRALLSTAKLQTLQTWQCPSLRATPSIRAHCTYSSSERRPTTNEEGLISTARTPWRWSGSLCMPQRSTEDCTFCAAGLVTATLFPPPQNKRHLENKCRQCRLLVQIHHICQQCSIPNSLEILSTFLLQIGNETPRPLADPLPRMNRYKTSTYKRPGCQTTIYKPKPGSHLGALSAGFSTARQQGRPPAIIRVWTHQQKKHPSSLAFALNKTTSRI